MSDIQIFNMSHMLMTLWWNKCSISFHLMQNINFKTWVSTNIINKHQKINLIFVDKIVYSLQLRHSWIPKQSKSEYDMQTCKLIVFQGHAIKVYMNCTHITPHKCQHVPLWPIGHKLILFGHSHKHMIMIVFRGTTFDDVDIWLLKKWTCTQCTDAL